MVPKSYILNSYLFCSSFLPYKAQHKVAYLGMSCWQIDTANGDKDKDWYCFHWQLENAHILISFAHVMIHPLTTSNQLNSNSVSNRRSFYITNLTYLYLSNTYNSAEKETSPPEPISKYKPTSSSCILRYLLASFHHSLIIITK